MKLAAIINLNTLKILNSFDFRYSFENFDEIFYLNSGGEQNESEIYSSLNSIWTEVSSKDTLFKCFSDEKIDYVCNLAITDKIINHVNATSLLSLLSSPKQHLETLEKPSSAVIIPADCLSSSKVEYINSARVTKLILNDESIAHDPGLDLSFPFGGVFLSHVDFYSALNRPINEDLGKEHDVYVGHKIRSECKQTCAVLFDDISLSTTKLITKVSKGQISKKEKRYLYSTYKELYNEYKDLKKVIDGQNVIKSETNKFNCDEIFYWMLYGLLLNQDLVNWFNTSAYEYDYYEMLNSNLNPLSHYYLKNEKAKLLPSNLNYNENFRLLESSKVFNETFYLKENPDVARSGMKAIEHFLKHGWKEFRDPSSKFDMLKYYQDVFNLKHLDFNPLIHHIIWSK